MPDNVFKDTLYMYSVEGQGRKQATGEVEAARSRRRQATEEATSEAAEEEGKKKTVPPH